MKRYFLKISLILFGIAGVFSQLQAKECLNGVLENGFHTHSVALYFATNGNMQEPLEVSAVDADGHFSFHYRPKAIGFFTLQFENAKSVLCVLRPGKTVYLTVDARTGMLVKTANSDENTLLQSYHQQLINLDVRRNALLKAHQEKENPDFEKEMATLETDRLNGIVALCESHTDNYAAAALLEFLDADIYSSTYEKVLVPLRKKYRKDAFLEHKWEQLQASLRTATGNPAPDFSLPDSTGKRFSLEQYRGKVVMLAFWASWNSDCRRTNPYVRYLYQKYHPKGLEVIGISLDGERDRWVSAVRSDSLEWLQLSSLKSWECSAAKSYNIHWIPTLVLIDKEGRIVARRLEGEALETKIRSLLP